ncbi:MAG: hypothetical protein ABEI96_06735 [Haloarculaceae archaeon]
MAIGYLMATVGIVIVAAIFFTVVYAANKYEEKLAATEPESP